MSDYHKSIDRDEFTPDDDNLFCHMEIKIHEIEEGRDKGGKVILYAPVGGDEEFAGEFRDVPNHIPKRAIELVLYATLHTLITAGVGYHEELANLQAYVQDAFQKGFIDLRKNLAQDKKKKRGRIIGTDGREIN